MGGIGTSCTKKRPHPGRNLGPFPPKNSPEREKIGGLIGVDAGVKMGIKKGPAAICYEPFSGCHYSRDFMRVLNQTLSQYLRKNRYIRIIAFSTRFVKRNLQNSGKILP